VDDKGVARRLGADAGRRLRRDLAAQPHDALPRRVERAHAVEAEDLAAGREVGRAHEIKKRVVGQI
jgi:hypothetical protein